MSPRQQISTPKSSEVPARAPSDRARKVTERAIYEGTLSA